MSMGTVGRALSAVLVCAAAVGACKKDSAPQATPPPAEGSAAKVTPPAPPVPPPAPAEPGTWYLARLTFKDIGDLPFFLHLPPKGQNGKGQVVNGEEKVEFKVEWRENEVTVTGPWNYTSEILAEQSADGKLQGTWTRDTPLWGAVVRDFTATPIATPDPKTRFPSTGTAKPVDVTGTWEFDFAEHKAGKGAFQQGADGVVRGYMKPGQLGDIRFLAGNVSGTKLSLSQFNGNVANLVLANVSADGNTMSGMMSMQNVWNEKFTAKKVPDFQFINKVRLKDGKTKVTLKGLDKYKGKPTLAIIFATWCPACNDATPYFVQLYQTFHPQGLEVLGVAFDLSLDQKSNQKQIDIFRDKYKLPWELLQAPCTPDTWAKTMPQELEGWDGFPVLLLIKPDGTVQTVFGGWFGPATGPEGEKLRAWFTDQTKALVAAK